MLYVQFWTPGDGRKDRPKHVEWYSINSKNCASSWFYYRNCMRMLDARARTHTHTHTTHSCSVHPRHDVCYLNTQFKSPIWDKVFSQKNSNAQILVYEITYNEVKKLKTKRNSKKKNGADTCSRQGRTVVLPEARILFLNALSDRRIFDDKMAGLQFRRKQNSHSHTQSVRSTILYVRCWSLFIYLLSLLDY